MVGHVPHDSGQASNPVRSSSSPVFLQFFVFSTRCSQSRHLPFCSYPQVSSLTHSPPVCEGGTVGIVDGDVVGSVVGDVVGLPVAGAVGLPVGDVVGPGVGSVVGYPEGVVVGDLVGPTVGLDVVGLVVGPIVGDTVGVVVGDRVGSMVGRNVGDKVGSTSHVPHVKAHPSVAGTPSTDSSFEQRFFGSFAISSQSLIFPLLI